MRSRRVLLAALAAWAGGAPLRAQARSAAARSAPARADADNQPPGDPSKARPLVRPAPSLPRDHGAHPEQRIEWWYVTGHAHRSRAGEAADAAQLALTPPDFGFQATFFRARLPHTQGLQSAFAARQLLFAHAAVTDLRRDTWRGTAAHSPRFAHAQRVARVSGHASTDLARYSLRTAQVALRDWLLERTTLRDPGSPLPDARADAASRYTLRIDAGASPTDADAAGGQGIGLSLRLSATQPALLQGQRGWSRKGPAPEQVSGYITEPQLRTEGVIALGGERFEVQGRAWLDHEWSDQLLAPGSVGWDWIGMNLDDGSALTAFRIRADDARAVWDGGSLRTAAQARQGQVTPFGPGEVAFHPLRHWRSPASGANYPVEWLVQTPQGSYTVRALHDAQELDSRRSTGAFYWEGLCDLLDGRGQRVGRGYLEMTGYAGALRL